MKRIIFLKLLNISRLLVKICCYLNFPKIIALIFLISLRKNTLINYEKKTFKSIIVLDKSFGVDDLNFSFRSKKSKINFFMMQRSLIRVIFDFYFKNVKNKKFKISHTLYFTKNHYIKQQQRKYRNFLEKILRYLFKFKKIDGFLSFNLFYMADFELQNACLNLNKKFFVSHKESVILVDEVRRMLPIFWGKRFKKCK